MHGVAHFKLRIGGRTLLLPDGEHDIGRMSDCWLTLDDELASRYHARFIIRGPKAVLEDLGSRNGTFVNGQKLNGRTELGDGDKVRIGREIIAVLASEADAFDDEEDLKRTLAPGEDTRFPSLIGQLVEKSLKVGKIKEAERYATALSNQLAASRVAVDHPAATACVKCLLGLAERSSSGIWVDRLFKLFVSQGWIMSEATIEQVRAALDRIPRVPGTGIRDYEAKLRLMAREGTPVPTSLSRTVAELADAYGAG